MFIIPKFQVGLSNNKLINFFIKIDKIEIIKIKNNYKIKNEKKN